MTQVGPIGAAMTTVHVDEELAALAPEDPHRDCQVTLAFADGTVQTFPILRDRGMRWRGLGTEAPLVAIDAEWFHNPPTIGEKEDTS